MRFKDEYVTTIAGIIIALLSLISAIVEKIYTVESKYGSGSLGIFVGIVTMIILYHINR